MTDTVRPRNVRPDRPSGTTQQAAHGKFDAAADAAAAVAMAAPGSYFSNVIDGVYWSYSAAPTGGNLQISSGAVILLNLDITAAGPGLLPLAGFSAGPGLILTATLAAGGGGVVGKIGLLGPRIEKVG